VKTSDFGPQINLVELHAVEEDIKTKANKVVAHDDIRVVLLEVDHKVVQQLTLRLADLKLDVTLLNIFLKTKGKCNSIKLADRGERVVAFLRVFCLHLDLNLKQKERESTCAKKRWEGGLSPNLTSAQRRREPQSR